MLIFKNKPSKLLTNAEKTRCTLPSNEWVKIMESCKQFLSLNEVLTTALYCVLPIIS